MADITTGAAINLPPQGAMPSVNQDPTQATQGPDGEVYQPVVKVSLMLRNPDINSRGDAFVWATPLAQEYRSYDGTVIQGAPGNFQLYGLTDQFYELVGDSPTGKVLNDVVLTGRALGGLYDWVPPAEVPALLKAFGLTLDQVPEPYYVAQTTPKKDRMAARATARVANLATMAAQGGQSAALAAVKAKTGFGSLGAGSTDAKSILDQIRQAQNS